MTDHREDHADRHGFGGPDQLNLAGYPGMGGDTLWVVQAGVLKPVTVPTAFRVDAGTVQLNSTGLVSVVANTSLQLSSSTGTTVAASTGGVDLSANTRIRVGMGAEEVQINTEATAAGGTQGNGTVVPWLDEANDLVMATVRESNGTVRNDVLTTPSGAWVPYTLTISGTGWALGNATVVARYLRVGRLIALHARIVWGSTSTYGSGGLVLSVPVAAAANAVYTSGHASYSDAGTGFGWGFSQITGGALTPYAYLVSGTRLTGTQMTTSSPHAWAVNDDLEVDIVYEAAS